VPLGRGETVCRLSKTLFFLVTAVFAAPLGADERGYSFGLGVETGGSSLSSFRFGAAFLSEVRPLQLFSFGIRGTAAVVDLNLGFNYIDPNYISAFDALALARLYLFSPKTLRPLAAELFFEVNGGLHTVWRNSPEGSVTVAAMGGAAGVRILFGKPLYPENAHPANTLTSKTWLYMEPFVRGTYPMSFSAGLLVGGRIRTHPDAAVYAVAEHTDIPTPEQDEPAAETELQPVMTEPALPEASNSAVRTADVFLLMFAPDSAVYDGPALQGAVREENRESLRRIAAILRDYPLAQVVVEGATAALLYPRQNLPAASLTIGERRAFAVIEYLYAAGIDLSRVVLPGERTTPAAPQDGQVQRIEVRVIR
jgi:outer membrane protein OmpA-like peptidoglycan-associated protein